MEVIKKDGRLQELNEEKIKTSILNASNSTEDILNESDINILSKDVVKLVNSIRSNYKNTSSYEITGAIIEVLKRDGFIDIIDSYLGFYKKK